MKKVLDVGIFEELRQSEMMEIDGGKGRGGQVVGLTGGTVAFSTGVLITFVGICTVNPAVAGAGFALTCGGVSTIAGNV